jgi:alkanesulfonate monooxygenase SsuD/methylene tetrahydromethanopterin reductase-like flavin-dependent oxidoreductase (luciferase family)
VAIVELGVHTGPQDIELDELRRLWRYCDEHVFDWISVWDHFYESPPRDGNGPAYEAIASLAALALETRNVRVSCLVFCMGYRNPALLAKAMTTIDHLSHGRLTVGLGAGWHVPEHEGYGYALPPVKERLDRLSEGIRVIRLMLTQERSDFDGRYYRLDNAANIPQPVQARVPIIVGGGGEQRSLRIAALRADGSNQTYMSAEAYRHKNEVLDEWCEHYKRDPKTLERSINLHFQMTSTGNPEEKPSQGGGLWGRPQQVIDMIGEYADAGALRINVAIRPPLDWDAIQSYAEDVLPVFKK